MSGQILGIINPFMALIIAICAYLIWRRDRSKRYILVMALAPVALAISFIANHYFVMAFPMAMRLVTTVFAFVAVIAVVAAACARLEKRAPVGIWVLGAAATIALMAFSDPARDVFPWVLLVNIYCGIVFVMGAQLLGEARSSEPIDRAAIWVFGLIAAQFFLRPALVYMLDGPMGSDAYRESAGHASYIVIGAICMVLLAAVLIGSAMTDLMKALRLEAHTDSLSGLTMRDAFVERAGQMLVKARVDDLPISIIVADIDHFKKVNDVWGHPSGDQAIANFGRVFLRTIRTSDLAGRIGGEEFAVIVWNCPEEPAARLAERLRVQFACETHDALGPDIRLTASFGVTAWRAGESYHQAYERADAALYEAKRKGRNRVVSTLMGQVAPGVPNASINDDDPVSASTAARTPEHRGAGVGLAKLSARARRRRKAG